jgi:argininosuccinate synthase
MDRIVLAYSGGLNASVAVAWLAQHYGAEIVCVTMDLGQGTDLESVRERALAAGAIRAHVLDVREEFARQHVLPALQAGAVFANGGPLATALGRPIIARKLVEIARIEGTSTVAHGCSDQGHDRTCLETPVHALMPGGRVIAPACEWDLTRPQQIEYARQRGIPLPAAERGSFDVDTNLWGRSITRGDGDDAWTDPPAGLFAITRDPDRCPDEPAFLDLQFEQGIPSAVSGVTMPFMDVIASVSTIAGAHGVGRVDASVSGPAGPAVREFHEAPAAVVLHLAHGELESLLIPHALLRVKRGISTEYAGMIDQGLWYSPVREAMDAFVATVQARVTGTVRIRLHKGSAHVVGRKPGLDEPPAESRKAD